jgi:uncharacterized protein YcbK (DUF882 family)
MANEENLKKAKGFDKLPENINKEGRPKGVKNRATIAKAIMSMKVNYPEEILEGLKKMYPDMTNNVTVEEAMTIMQAAKAIQDKDTNAYKALMDSGYGSPNQKIDTDISQTIQFKNVSKQFPDE